MDILALEIMTDKLVTVSPDMKCEEAVVLLIDNQISGAPVVDGEFNLVGVISVHDILNFGVNVPYVSTYLRETELLEQLLKKNKSFHEESIKEGFVQDFMTTEVYSATGKTNVKDLAQQMMDKRVHRIIIVDETSKKPIGIVTTFDILKYVTSSVVVG